MKPKSCVIYSGPSKIDGSPIVCVYIPASGNIKTGNMAQTYILRADIDPITASRTGADYAICGDCKHRGQVSPSKITGWASNRSCYVNLGQGPGQVYKAYNIHTILKYHKLLTTLTRSPLNTLGVEILFFTYVLFGTILDNTLILNKTPIR